MVVVVKNLKRNKPVKREKQTLAPNFTSTFYLCRKFHTFWKTVKQQSRKFNMAEIPLLLLINQDCQMWFSGWRQCNTEDYKLTITESKKTSRGHPPCFLFLAFSLFSEVRRFEYFLQHVFLGIFPVEVSVDGNLCLGCVVIALAYYPALPRFAPNKSLL